MFNFLLDLFQIWLEGRPLTRRKHSKSPIKIQRTCQTIDQSPHLQHLQISGNRNRQQRERQTTSSLPNNLVFAVFTPPKTATLHSFVVELVFFDVQKAYGTIPRNAPDRTREGDCSKHQRRGRTQRERLRCAALHDCYEYRGLLSTGHAVRAVSR